MADLTQEAIKAATVDEDDERDDLLSSCDERYYAVAGDLAGPLLSYIKAHRKSIVLG